MTEPTNGVATKGGPDLQPLVSVCIAHYGDAGVLRACLESVIHQQCVFPYEILVHDDASPEGLDDVPDSYPGTIWLTSETNVGYCVANNRMARAARGRYLLLLNNDAELFPDALQTLADEAVRIGGPAILGLPQYDRMTGDLEDRGRLCDPFLMPIHNRNAAIQDVAMVAGACLWISADMWRDLGGFPEWFEMIAEDLYLCCRVRLRGYPVRVATRSGFRHRIGATVGGGTMRGRLATTVHRRSLSERNRCFTMLVCYPAPWHAVVFTVHALLLLLEGLIVSAVLRSPHLFGAIYWSALTSVWHERRRLWAARDEVQDARRATVRAFFSAFRFTIYKASLLLRFGWPSLR